MYIGSLKPATNRESWQEIFEIYDSETGDPLDLTGAVIVLELRDQRNRRPNIAAAIAIIDIGKFTASLTVDQMRNLRPQTYDVGLTIARDDETTELILGTIAVFDGVVR